MDHQSDTPPQSPLKTSHNGNGRAPDVSVVIPLRNERPAVTALHRKLVATLKGRSYELLFVDDGSDDGSVDLLAHIASVDPRVRVLRLRASFGKAAALATGFGEARGRAIVTIDADLQDDPADIPALLAALERGADLVSGWKQHRQDRRTRRIASRVFNRAVRLLTHLPMHDANCGLKAYRAACAKELTASCYGDLHRYLPVVAHFHGFRVEELPVTNHPRAHGRSRYGPTRYARAFLDLFTTALMTRFARRPLHFFGMPALGILAAGCTTLGVIAVRALMFGAPVSGWPAGAAVVALLMGTQLLLAGLVAELASRPAPGAVPYEHLARGGTVTLDRRALIVLPASGETNGARMTPAAGGER